MYILISNFLVKYVIVGRKLTLMKRPPGTKFLAPLLEAAEFKQQITIINEVVGRQMFQGSNRGT